MKFFGQTLAMLLGLALLGALGVGGYSAVKFSVGLFARLDFQVAAVTVIAAAVTLLAAMIIARSIRQASQQHKANQLHAEKAATYQLFIDLWGNLLQPGRDVEARSPNTLSAELPALDRLLALYGSSGVVKAHGALRALVRENGAQNPSVRAQFVQALLEIRKDLGAETQGLTADEVLQLIFTNPDKANISPKANAYQDRQPRISLSANI